MRLRQLVILVVAVLVRRCAGTNDDDNVVADEDSVAFQQARALFHFYVSTRMYSFRSRRKHNWFRGGVVSEVYCSFTGVKCDNDGYVQSLSLRNKGLSGTLSIGNFTRLRSLRLESNFIRGQIPTESMASLQDLRVLNLGQNNLSGTLPDFSSLASLMRLMLFENLLTGSVPTTLCSVTDMTHLYLSGNTKMRGTLPTCLASLSKLASLKVTNVGLTGTLPSPLCRLLNGDSSSSDCDDVVGCSAGYFRKENYYLNATRCMPCEIPSNAVASTACKWIGDSSQPSDSPTVFPSMPPSYTPSIASSSAPSGIQAAQESITPTMTIMPTATTGPTPMSESISAVAAANQARKRSITISAVAAITFMTFVVVALAFGARHRNQSNEKIELESDEASSVDPPLVATDSAASSQNVRVVSPPERNSTELRSPTSLPFIRPRRSPKTLALSTMLPSDAVTLDEHNNGTNLLSWSESTLSQSIESRLTAPSTTTASTNPPMYRTVNISGTPRIRSSLKLPASNTPPDDAKPRLLSSLKHVRFSGVGDSVHTFYEESSDYKSDLDDAKLTHVRGTYSWNHSSTNPVANMADFDLQVSSIGEEVDGSTLSTDSIYDFKKPAARLRNCPMIGMLSCGSVPLEGEQADSETKDSVVVNEIDEDEFPCFPCSPSSKRGIASGSMKRTKVVDDQTRSISPSSTHSSEDEILTSLGVIHDPEEKKGSKGLARHGRQNGPTRFAHSAHALMDDESTLESKDSTLFSSESDGRYADGLDQAEI
ncbi:hypothetical protein MPSEU_000534800 [Mayamaea pseudoterrestris]|nr:hypothetical protein MPSEU_000534800 [Mayamaea pseudoterrestris]